MRVLCIGDVVGKPGRLSIEKVIDSLKRDLVLDAVVANVENAAGGAGLTSRLAKHFLRMGCDVLTVGDHAWDQKELEWYLQEETRLIRPANYPDAPGQGFGLFKTATGAEYAVISLVGRVFMRYQVDCPFRKFDSIYEQIKDKTSAIIVDFHAEATSEKIAFSRYVDGRASLVFGTHTHVQTADEKILPNGTGYITDVGMTGPHDSVIGQEIPNIIKRYLTSRPVKFSVATGDPRVNGIVAEINNGKTANIQRVNISVEIEQSQLDEKNE
jgi:metallophosphoesterase (TIGR00282 family)